MPKLARIIDRLSNLKLDNGTEHFEPSHIVVTVISVPNTATNVIPGQARARFNVRYNDAHDRPRLEARLREACDSAAAEVGARFTLTFSGTGSRVRDRAGPAR